MGVNVPPRRIRRRWGKRALNHEARSRIAKVQELAIAGYEPSAIASVSKLPRQLVEDLLEYVDPHPGGRGPTYE
jgi:hypothetical protein